MAELLAEKARRVSRNKLARYAPYAKQREFHAAGAKHRERLFMAGNQLGKTLGGGAEIAMHVTGRYPDWWDGRRFDRPTKWMAGSESAELTRKGIQRTLLGTPEDRSQWGTGFIPGECIIDTSPRPGVPNAVSAIMVRHVTGGTSVISLNSYDQGRSKWQAETVDGVWFDEEPPEDVYMEGITRTNRTFGPILLTFTPLLGMSSVVMRYLSPTAGDPGADDRIVINMTIDDAEHYSPEERARIIASYPAHEREARTKGIPSLGDGRVFPVPEEAIAWDAHAIPAHWKRLGGMDFGWDHPTTGVEIAWDAEADIIYVVKAYAESRQIPAIHASALKPWGVKFAWPGDGLNTEKSGGEALVRQYEAQGLPMLPVRAQFEDGSVSVEAGLMEILGRMETGRFKVARHLETWWREFRLYRRERGKVVKTMDDLMDATRYAVMMLRYAESKRSGPDPFAWDTGMTAPFTF